MAFFWSQSKKLTCGFKKYAIVGSIILKKIGQHQMKCLRTKCIETFPICIYIFFKILILHYQVLLVNKSHSEPHVFIWIF